MSEEFWLLLGALGLAIGAGAITLLGGTTTARQGARTALHALVALIATVAYVAMFTGNGSFDFDGDGNAFLYVRYIDWAITTPLLLLALSITAMPVGRTAWPLVAALLFADVGMIVSGAIAAQSIGLVRWVWFLASVGAFVAVLAILWLPLRELADSGHPLRSETYRSHTAVLTILWAVYPVVFLLSPDMFGALGGVATVAAFTVLDVTAKTGYGVLVTLEDGRMIDAEQAERFRTKGWRDEERPATEGGRRRSNWDTARDRLLTMHYRRAARREAETERAEERRREAASARAGQASPAPAPAQPRRITPAQRRMQAQRAAEARAEAARSAAARRNERRPAGTARSEPAATASRHDPHHGPTAHPRPAEPLAPTQTGGGPRTRWLVVNGEKIAVIRSRATASWATLEAVGPALRRGFATRRDVVARGEAEDVRSRPRRQRPLTPFGRLRASDAAPVALVAATLLLISRGPRGRR